MTITKTNALSLLLELKNLNELQFAKINMIKTDTTKRWKTSLPRVPFLWIESELKIYNIVSINKDLFECINVLDYIEQQRKSIICHDDDLLDNVLVMYQVNLPSFSYDMGIAKTTLQTWKDNKKPSKIGIKLCENLLILKELENQVRIITDYKKLKNIPYKNHN